MLHDMRVNITRHLALFFAVSVITVFALFAQPWPGEQGWLVLALAGSWTVICMITYAGVDKWPLAMQSLFLCGFAAFSLLFGLGTRRIRSNSLGVYHASACSHADQLAGRRCCNRWIDTISSLSGQGAQFDISFGAKWYSNNCHGSFCDSCSLDFDAWLYDNGKNCSRCASQCARGGRKCAYAAARAKTN